MTDQTQNLEIKIAHLTEEVQELNDIVTRQSQEIDTLKAYTKLKINELKSSLGDISKEDGKSVTDIAASERPPHY